MGSKCYDYVLLYVDDALVVSENAESILRNELGRYFELKEKFTGPPDHYLGGKVRKVQFENSVNAWAFSSSQYVHDTFLTKIPIAPCYCQMMGRTLKEEIKITQYNNPTKAGKYSLEVLFRASDNIPDHYPKF